MTERRQNELMASLYRQMFLAKMLDVENRHFIQYPVNSGVKGCLKRMKDCYESNLR